MFAFQNYVICIFSHVTKEGSYVGKNKIMHIIKLIIPGLQYLTITCKVNFKPKKKCINLNFILGCVKGIEGTVQRG